MQNCVLWLMTTKRLVTKVPLNCSNKGINKQITIMVETSIPLTEQNYMHMVLLTINNNLFVYDHAYATKYVHIYIYIMDIFYVIHLYKIGGARNFCLIPFLNTFITAVQYSLLNFISKYTIITPVISAIYESIS